MRDHEFYEVNDAIDSRIRRDIKNWAAQQQPPANGRARLLLVAAANPVVNEPWQSNRVAGRLDDLAAEFTGSMAAINPFQQSWWTMHLTLVPVRHMT